MSRANFGRNNFQRYIPAKKKEQFLCKYENDDGTICNKHMTLKEFEQDGICSVCADKLWDWCKDNLLNYSKGG